jgi:hypothetical protein
MQATDLRMRVLVLTAIVIVAIVIVVAVRGGGTVVNVEAFARDVQQLTTDTSIDLAQLAPAEVERNCVAGDDTACALHSVNATAVADRIDVLFEALAALPLSREARGWVTDYGDALAALRAGWRAQTVALRMSDAAAFDAALVATTEARALEQRLIQQFERDYADELSGAAAVA